MFLADQETDSIFFHQRRCTHTYINIYVTISYYYYYKTNMSNPVQQYPSNNDTRVNQQPDRTLTNGTNDGDIFRSFLGLTNRMMSDMMQNGPSTKSFSSLSSLDPGNPNMKLFGISSTNITQMSRGPDGRPRIVQAHDERRMGPGGVWQTKKALRDPDRGIDRMQLGYFVGDRGEIFERNLDPTTGQYRHETKRRGIPPNEQNFTTNQWKGQAQQVTQRPQAVPQQSPQQRLSYIDQYPQQVTSTPSYNEQSSQAGTYYNQPPQQPPAATTSYQYY